MITQNSDVGDEHPRRVRVHLTDVQATIFPAHPGDRQSPVVWILETNAVPGIGNVSGITQG